MEEGASPAVLKSLLAPWFAMVKVKSASVKALGQEILSFPAVSIVKGKVRVNGVMINHYIVVDGIRRVVVDNRGRVVFYDDADVHGNGVWSLVEFRLEVAWRLFERAPHGPHGGCAKKRRV